MIIVLFSHCSRYAEAVIQAGDASMPRASVLEFYEGGAQSPRLNYASVDREQEMKVSNDNASAIRQ
jgi:hypothetical protein